jgi:hypothetical protein
MARKQKTGQKVLVVMDCTDSVLKRLQIERPYASRKRLSTGWLCEHVDGRAYKKGSKNRIVVIYGNDSIGEDYEVTYKTWRCVRDAVAERLRELSLKGQPRLPFTPAQNNVGGGDGTP